MIEQAHQILLDAYEKHKQLHTTCPKEEKDKQGNPVCQTIHEFEKTIEFAFQEIRYNYNQDLANSDNRILTYNSKKEFLKNSFLDDRYIFSSPVNKKTYINDIKEDFVKALKKKRIQSPNYELITLAFAQCRLYDWLKENPPPEIENAVIDMMVWNGTQKQLAELFVELQRKGWIEKIDSNTISQIFTNTKSVKQYLKPMKNKHTDYQITYENLYGPMYEKIFDNIKDCTKGS